MTKFFSRLYGVYIAPAAVFQSVLIGGGYGTGREVVEYFSSNGAIGGLLGLGVAALGFFSILFLCFEIARRSRAYDYRSLLRQFTGRLWIGFEICFLFLFVIVLGVLGAATGDIVKEEFGLSPAMGSIGMLAAIIAIATLGRGVVLALLTIWSLVLCCVFGFYFYEAFSMSGAAIGHALAQGEVGSRWAVSGLEYVFYNAAVAPIIIYAARSIETTKEALIAALAAALMAVIPAALFHLSFLADLPRFGGASVPVYDVIRATGKHWLLVVYLVALVGTFVETGLGFVQGVIERIDGWLADKGKPPAKKWQHALIAAGAISVSAALSMFGIINLIATGYRFIAWGLFASFILPLLTIGAYRIWIRRDLSEH